MSTPPPQQHPGPYGPPHPPHQQPYPAQSYPAQPHPGRPYPGQPYPPQPHPGQGAWGQPPMGPPQRKNRTGMVIGIVAASLVALGVLGFGVKLLTGATGGFPEATHRLTVPKTLLDGKYQLDQDLSATAGQEALKGTYDSKVRDPKPAVGQYTAKSPQGTGALVISGMYGRFKDPASARRKMLDGAEDAEGAKVAVPARDITPLGSDITVSCQVLTVQQGGAEGSLPICAWADENTGASVGFVTPETTQQKPASVDLATFAEATLKVRAEARQPIG
ncbi:hypothetical protein ADK53_13610 [Streptomyces sp. WM6373]|uniref:hypothetical protein n=1 Tax=unclassified Streptomyces TaxID=2593676 RepID=UPI0006AEE843|nr:MULTISPECIES: hypothetical protein [unclassified Streptomyces]KOU35972.1 hypothetical protein ADK53_13610 [Streptomyces sp. WM6373]KOU75625.1 hypothetical protein ADK61_15510 [Streptomyces sp. XY66]KOV33745.1 hypothetical protein ADK97_18050 [Streptomyces sp. H021]